jgi:hypothetical protein
MTNNTYRNAFDKHGIRLKLRRPGLAAAGATAVIAAGVVGTGAANAATSSSTTSTGQAHALVTAKGSQQDRLTAAAQPGGRSAMTRPAVVGTVTSVGSGRFTVQTKSGSVTIDVDASTSYLDGTTSASFSSLAVGQHVAVVGADSEGVVTATRVLLGTPPAPNGPGSSAKPASLPPAAPATSGAPRAAAPTS